MSKLYNLRYLISVELYDSTIVVHLTYVPEIKELKIGWFIIRSYRPEGFVANYNKFYRFSDMDKNFKGIYFIKDKIVYDYPYLEFKFINNDTKNKWFNSYKEAEDFKNNILSYSKSIIGDDTMFII